jgi:very-short-patch-repair endonuclease
MSEVTTEPGQSSTSTTEQAKERLGEGAQQIQEKASEAKARTRERVREQIDTRSTETGEQMTSTASALRQTAQRLRTEDQGTQAKVLEQIADRTERFGRYLTETDGDRLLRDIERIARRRPWLVAGGGTVLGFLAARFTKASSSRRYQENGSSATGVRSTPALPRGSAADVRGGGDSGD